MCALTEEARRLDKRVASHTHGTRGAHVSRRARHTIEHCSFFRPSGTQYEQNTGSALPMPDLRVPPRFQGRGKLLVQNPDLPWAAEFRQTRAERFAVIRCLVEQGPANLWERCRGELQRIYRLPRGPHPDCGRPDLSPVYVLNGHLHRCKALGRSDLGHCAGKAADLVAVQGNPCTTSAPSMRLCW
jgi:imidazolonepropionase-like amidohydrolase